MCAKFHCPSSTVALFSVGGWNPPPPGHRKPKKLCLNRVKERFLIYSKERFSCKAFDWIQALTSPFPLPFDFPLPPPLLPSYLLRVFLETLPG